MRPASLKLSSGCTDQATDSALSAVKASSSASAQAPYARIPRGPSSTAVTAIRPAPSVNEISTVVMSARFRPPPATNATNHSPPPISSVGSRASARDSQRWRADGPRIGPTPLADALPGATCAATAPVSMPSPRGGAGLSVGAAGTHDLSDAAPAECDGAGEQEREHGKQRVRQRAQGRGDVGVHHARVDRLRADPQRPHAGLADFVQRALLLR